VPMSQLLHRSRCRAPVAHSRQVAMYLMHTLLGRTMTEVGRYFGRDRTTVAYACGCVEDLRDDMKFDTEITALEERLCTPADIGFSSSPEPAHAGH
jgi:chromosomal replication initiation ATPase DnaA